MGTTDKIFEEVVITEARRGRYGKQARRPRKQQQPRKQQSKQQPQQQTGLGDFEMSHEQSTLMAFMGIAKRVIGDLQRNKFDDEMIDVLDKVLIAVDESVRDQRLKAQYGKGFKKYRKDA